MATLNPFSSNVHHNCGAVICDLPIRSPGDQCLLLLTSNAPVATRSSTRRFRRQFARAAKPSLPVRSTCVTIFQPYGGAVPRR
jgi:hypothetical protein